ncbi:MAG: cell wall-binding repeat-containing protein [Coriobacteriales bacterium]|jgi:putative cell wall-binding protein
MFSQESSRSASSGRRGKSKVYSIFAFAISIVMVLSFATAPASAYASDDLASEVSLRDTSSLDIGGIETTETTFDCSGVAENGAFESSNGESSYQVMSNSYDSYSEGDVVELLGRSDAIPFARIAGKTRYDTMQSIVNSFSNFDTVVLASGKNFPDALAASSIAGIYHCPIVLTDSSALSSQASSIITSHSVKNVLIIGGPAAISSNVENSLKSLGCTNIKRVYGKDRVGTSVAVYNFGTQAASSSNGFITSSTEWNDMVILATSQSFADALSISPIAFNSASPILLVNPKTGLTQDEVNTIKNFRYVLIVGGAGAVSTNVETSAKQLVGSSNVQRISGKNRYATSKNIADLEIAAGYGTDEVFVASGKNFPDALAGGPLCGTVGKVMILTDADNFSIAQDFVSSNDTSQIYLLGGTAAVDSATAIGISDTFWTEDRYDEGSFSYFNYRESTSAYEALTECTYASFNKKNDSNDATSLPNFYYSLYEKSLNLIGQCNSLRAENGLTALKVSDLMMARAQADANWSNVNHDHAQQFSVGENLCWGTTNPFSLWYTVEKEEYDSGHTEFSDTGHYQNIVNGNYRVSGAAVCTRNGNLTCCQTFSFNNDSDSEDLDTYTARVFFYTGVAYGLS